MRLAGVGHLGGQEVVEPVGDLLGHRVEQPDPLVDRQSAPLPVQRRAGRGDRGVHLRFAGLIHGADQRIVDRRAISNVFPLAFLMYSPLTKFRMSVLTMGFPPVLGYLTVRFLTPGMMTVALPTTALPRIAPHVRRA